MQNLSPKQRRSRGGQDTKKRKPDYCVIIPNFNLLTRYHDNKPEHHKTLKESTEAALSPAPLGESTIITIEAPSRCVGMHAASIRWQQTVPIRWPTCNLREIRPSLLEGSTTVLTQTIPPLISSSLSPKTWDRFQSGKQCLVCVDIPPAGNYCTLATRG